MKTESVITLLMSNEINSSTKCIILSNYFNILCDDMSYITAIKDNTLDPVLIAYSLDRYSYPQYTSCSKIIEPVIISIISNRHNYIADIIDKALVALGRFDNTYVVDNYCVLSKQNAFDNHYGAFIEYLISIIDNDYNRIFVILSLLIEDGINGMSDNYVSSTALLDLTYIYSDRLISGSKSNLKDFVMDMMQSLTFNDIPNAFDKHDLTRSFCFFDYNRSLETLHYKFGHNITWNGGCAPVEKTNNIFKVVINDYKPIRIDLSSNNYDTLQLTKLFSCNCSFIFGIPCLYNGIPKGEILFFANSDYVNDDIIEMLLLSKHMAILIDRFENDLLTTRYYEHFSKQHSISINSFKHTVSPTLGNIKTELERIVRNNNICDDDSEAINRCKSNCDIISDSLSVMMDYSSTTSEVLPLSNILETVMKTMRSQILDSKIDDIKIINDLRNPRVTKAPGLITVINNIITNSIESFDRNDTSNKCITIITEYCDVNKLVKIRFIDNGKGFASDIKDRAFNLGVSTKGSGLGLAIVKTLINGIGGSVYLGCPKFGAEVIIEIPGRLDP